MPQAVPVTVGSYTRIVELQEIEYTCADCGGSFTNVQYPGRIPERCPDCKPKHVQALAADRQRRRRAERRNRSGSGASE